MPRARTVTTEEETVTPIKRAPRKRAPKLDENGEVITPRPRAPRKRAVKTVEEEPPRAEREIKPETGRRAPTPLRAERQATTRGRRSLVIVLIVFLVICGVGVGIGMSDHGQIDVVAVVNERNERINRGEVREGESRVTVPVQNTDVRPNGGLVPVDPSATPPPATTPEATTTPKETATSSAESSSTESSEVEAEVVSEETVSETSE